MKKPSMILLEIKMIRIAIQHRTASEAKLLNCDINMLINVDMLKILILPSRDRVDKTIF